MCGSEKICNDKDIVMTAVQQNGMMLMCASHALKSDKEIVMAAVRQNPWGTFLFLISCFSLYPHQILYAFIYMYFDCQSYIYITLFMEYLMELFYSTFFLITNNYTW